MFRNNFKSAWRSLAKNKTFSILNIAGLSAGLTCFTLIALWVTDELSYDKFNKNYDRIVRLTGIIKTGAGVSESAVSSAPMAKALKNDYAEVENTVRFDMHEEIVQHKGQQLLQPGILLTDPSFFDVFSYKLLKGDAVTALNDPYSIILTESTAIKYFGHEDPIGQFLTINMYDSGGLGVPYKITGVMPDTRQNAHFTFNILGSFNTAEVANPDIMTVDGWGDASFYTYLLLKEGVDHTAFSNKMKQFYGKYIGEMFNAWKDIYSYKLQPLRDIHLRSHLEYEIAPTGNASHVYIFATIGIFILLLAAVNYVNLSIARSVGKAKEIGIKKVIGANRKQLIVQYISEAILTALISLIVSFLISSLLQPFFQQVTGKDLSLWSFPLLVCFLFMAAILLGIISGAYPAFILSGFKPAGVLKGSFKSGSKGVVLRKSLVVAQFTITVILITGIIIISSQMSYIKNKDLGFNKDALVYLGVNGNSNIINNYEAFKNEVLSNPLVQGMTVSNSMPVGGFSSGGSETINHNGEILQVNTARLRADQDYLEVYGISLLAGNNFTATQASDTIRPVILNEAAVKKFGWENAEFALGKPFRMGGQNGRIVGVIKNFHFNSLQQAIEPLVIYPAGDRFSRITLKMDMKAASRTIAWIEKIWKKHFASALFDYHFLDKQLGTQYLSEDRFSKVFLYFSVLSLLIACLGLYGLIAYTTLQKTKEIGIRKILGATANGIALMLSGQLLKLILLSLVIAIPIAWYIMNNWLEDFAYRTSITWWMFGASGLTVILIAFITIGLRAVKAAIANPVKSLRTE